MKNEAFIYLHVRLDNIYKQSIFNKSVRVSAVPVWIMVRFMPQ